MNVEVPSAGTIGDSTVNAVVESLLPISIAAHLCPLRFALVFSGLFTFGSGCGADLMISMYYCPVDKEKELV